MAETKKKIENILEQYDLDRKSLRDNLEALKVIF